MINTWVSWLKIQKALNYKSAIKFGKVRYFLLFPSSRFSLVTELRLFFKISLQDGINFLIRKKFFKFSSEIHQYYFVVHNSI
jgi:hypothetical protein